MASEGVGESQTSPLLVNSPGSPETGSMSSSIDKRPSCLVALLVSIGSVCVGYSLGFTSPATQQLIAKNGSSPQAHGYDLSLDKADISWFGSAVFVGAFVGGIIGGPLAGYCGRKLSLMISNALFIIGWILIACAHNLAALIAGRVVIGLAVGVSVLVNPIYLAEAVLPQLRGALTTTLQLSVSLGIVLSFAVGISMSYRHMAILGACISGLSGVLLFIVPETPRWYIRNGKREKGQKALQWLRGPRSTIYHEMSVVESKIQEEASIQEFSLLEIRLPQIYRPLLISIALMLFQVWSGSFAVTAYTAIIFDTAGLADKATVTSIGVAIVQFVVTAISLFIIDRSGRRPLLMAAGAGMALACAVMSFFFYFSDRIHGNGAIAMPIISIYCYMAAYSLGLGIIPWLFMAEVFPGRGKSVLSSISAATNWLNAFLNTRYFEELTELMSNAGMFLFLAIVCLLLVIFTRFVVPETKGRTLEQIQDIFKREGKSEKQCRCR